MITPKSYKMSKPFLLLLLFCFDLSLSTFSQKGTDTTVIKGQAAKDLVKKIGFDSTTFLKEISREACACIDSVDKTENDKNKKNEGIVSCIDKEVTAYQLSLKLLNSMKGITNDQTINIATDKNSDEYKKYYYDIERWLLDSCRVLKKAISSNDDKKSEKSLSNNTDAVNAYNTGVEFLQKEQYTEGIPWFEKAVKIDSVFAFAWDNLAICYRKTNQLEKAESAYKFSLRIDSSGKTALQNLPVVYMMQKRDDEAIAAYKNFLQYYSDDPEVYYGLALVYFNNKKDMENALYNICKAYNIYVDQKSPFRSDAEKVINIIYAQMKKENKEDIFNKILKENHIKPN